MAAGGPAGRPAAGSPAGSPADRPAAGSPALAVLSDLTGEPLESSLADFWSPGLSQARLRTLPPSPVTPPDLLLRLSDPPPIQVRGKGLRDILTPAYARLAADPRDLPGDADADTR
jgi:hypothetical protein